jgi:hypothetical protein
VGRKLKPLMQTVAKADTRSDRHTSETPSTPTSKPGREAKQLTSALHPCVPWRSSRLESLKILRLPFLKPRQRVESLGSLPINSYRGQGSGLSR